MASHHRIHATARPNRVAAHGNCWLFRHFSSRQQAISCPRGNAGLPCLHILYLQCLIQNVQILHLPILYLRFRGTATALSGFSQNLAATWGAATRPVAILNATEYDEYLAAGYPIGSGVVEGACRHLVKDRMEQTGMRWRIEGAQAILNLRAIYVNDDWAPFHAARIQAEQHKLYPYRQRLLAILTCAT